MFARHINRSSICLPVIKEVIKTEFEKFEKKRLKPSEKNIGEKNKEEVDKIKRFIANRLTRLVKRNFSKIDFNVPYQTPRTIGSMFPFKDNIKIIESKSLVIYRISCKEFQQKSVTDDFDSISFGY